MKPKASRPWWRGQRSPRKRHPSTDPSLMIEQGAIELSPATTKSQASSSTRWPFAPVFNSPWFWPFFISGATALGAAIWIFNLPPLPECRNVSLGTTDAEQLYCADMAARRGNINALMAALDLVSQWPQDHPLYTQALELSNQWSQATIVIARQQFAQGNIDYAKTIIQKVPKVSHYYPQAQSLLTYWTTDEGSSLAAQASSAINGADWAAALDIARRLSLLGSDHWSSVASDLIVRINREREAWGQLEQARGLAGWQTVNELVAAILMAKKINPETIAGQRVPQEIQPWVELVMDYAQEWQNAGNLEAAIDLVREIAPVLRATQGDPPLLQLGQAEAAAHQDTFWGYWEGIMRLEKLAGDSGLAAYVTRQQQAWERQAQNLGQLQLARSLAGLEQTWGYELAVLQAQSVHMGQPRRIEAQTLIAQWQRQIQASQAQPLLNAAQQLAQAEKYPAAQLIAQRISPTNPLYSTAQAEVKQWQATLQTKQDQPILAQAEALASHDKLKEAINRAAEIPAHSPLYQQAQARISDWYRERRRIEDAEAAARRPLWSAPSPEPAPETTEISPASSPEPAPETTPSLTPSPASDLPSSPPTPASPSPEAPLSPDPPPSPDPVDSAPVNTQPPAPDTPPSSPSPSNPVN
ncbi:hypothetical protein RIF25_12215 [Thermosynechococcaceae cyanobacterium BACA0444]|uniref:Chromosome segregation ATPase n=1 Tax=Pseudocalidococcus azoricus BACA0444 TaxID=2918990 RepID=A0AAE4FSZ2_9CYAN|nr:hypothetical protein [Pseudocalidococcus azoricus]MDS3861571.1 hypothetical protein [Pseudocalidococcus azoricus BACA0444]